MLRTLNETLLRLRDYKKGVILKQATKGAEALKQVVSRVLKPCYGGSQRF
jgi:hypothetical protein